ncbi:PDR/VanB family oxidoreductase [Streptomyces sp. NPDC055078]
MSASTAEAPRELRVQRVEWLAEDVLSVTLRDPAGVPLEGWTPGSHLSVHLPNGLSRDYSLCGDPDRGGEWTIAVLRDRASRGGSRWIHEQLRVGLPLTVTGPRNNFPLHSSAEYLLIAGGIGITPILSMARELSRTGQALHVLYCGRARRSMAFVPELRQLCGDRLVLHVDDEAGRPVDLGSVLAERPGADVYCCGPEALIEAVVQHAGEGREVRFERFRGRTADVAGSAGDPPFDVVCGRTGRRVTVETGTSVLDALAAAGVPVPSSCREGVCGTCETEVLSGVPDHRDLLLTEAEREDGATMMICVSRSRTPELTLDI